MSFLNPLDLLGIDSDDAPNPVALRKERKRRSLVFELEDGEVRLGGVRVTRSDFMRATDNLNDEEAVRHYHELQRHPELNRFLSTGDLSYFNGNGKRNGLSGPLVEFVSKPFADQYGVALAAAVRTHDAEVVRRLASHPPVAFARDLAGADRAVDALLSQMKRDVEEFRADVKAQCMEPDEATTETRLTVNVEVLNALPHRFAEKRSQIAQQVRHLGVAVFNERDDAESASILLADASRIDTPANVATDIAKQLGVVVDTRGRRRLYKRYESTLTACGEMVSGLRTLTEDVECKERPVTGLVKRACTLVRTDVINMLPDELVYERDRVAASVREFCIALWNERLAADAATAMLTAALRIRMGDDVRAELLEDRVSLARLKADEVDSDKREVERLTKLVDSFVDAVTEHRGSNVNWKYISEKLSAAFSAEVVALLIRTRQHSPGTVRHLIRTLCPLLAGLHRYARPDYYCLHAQLTLLIENDTELSGLVSPAHLILRSNPATRRATSGTPVWEQGWFWWIIGLGALFLLA